MLSLLCLLNRVCQFTSGLEFDNLLCLDGDLLLGSRIDTGAAWTLVDRECAEADKRYFVSLLQSRK